MGQSRLVDAGVLPTRANHKLGPGFAVNDRRGRCLCRRPALAKGVPLLPVVQTGSQIHVHEHCRFDRIVSREVASTPDREAVGLVAERSSHARELGRYRVSSLCRADFLCHRRPRDPWFLGHGKRYDERVIDVIDVSSEAGVHDLRRASCEASSPPSRDGDHAGSAHGRCRSADRAPQPMGDW
jgi:hypothetical protein